jgi:CHAD domain-containing protein
MAYRFSLDDVSVQSGFRRVAREQIDKGLSELDDRALDLHEAVHQVRKRTKKLRGLIRLVRPAFGAYSDENARLRDAAAELSSLRDTEALVETYDALIETYGDQVDTASLATIRHHLEAQRKQMAREIGACEKLSVFRTELIKARERAASWQLDNDGFEALEGGLAKTYKRARKTMKQARKDPVPEKLHAWRKRVKYHWYHTRLLQPVWTEPMAAHEDAVDDLAGLLGQHHDLSILREVLAERADDLGGVAEIEVLAGLAIQRQAAIEVEAFAVGAKLFAERPKALAKRWRVYWEVWREDEAARPVALAA